MFRKLGRQLTLFNLLTLVVVLATVAAFVFVGSPKTNAGEVTQAMWNAALTGELPEQGRRHSRNQGQGLLALITVDTTDTITSIETQMDLQSGDYGELTCLVLECSGSSGQVSLGDKEYVYLRFIEQPEQGTRIVLQERVALGQAAWFFLSRTTPVLLIIVVLVCAASLAITARALVPIRKAWERQVEFTADASHELRTPIAVIQTNLEVVLDEPEQPMREKEKWLDNIKAETDRMQKLVGDLLTLSRTDGGQRTLEKAVFNLSEELIKTVDPLIPYAQGRGVLFHSDISSDITCFGDAARIKQLVVILADNAIKHTPEGGNVFVNVKVQSWTVQIEVSDTGIGMEKQHLKKIFDRFYRIDKARERESGGFGLGLSIAKWIVEEHRGSIGVRSQPGEGTTFSVVLPMK